MGALRVLIIDDDDMKRRRVVKVVADVLMGVEVEVREVGNVNDGLNAIVAGRFDLVVLDIVLPLRKGEAERKDGGIIFLDMIRDRQDVQRPRYLVGLTAFEEIRSSCTDRFTDEAWTLVHYSADSEAWTIPIGRKLAYLLGGHGESVGSYEVGAAIVTALPDPELSAVLALPAAWRRHEIAGDPSVYFRGRFERGSKGLEVVAVSASHMGMSYAAAVASKLIYTFRPRFLTMVGMAAGVKGNCGDILIADQSYDYGSGKMTLGGNGARVLQPAPESLPVEPGMRCKMAAFAMDKSVLRRIEAEWQDERPNCHLACEIGPLASGAAVVGDREQVEAILAHNRKVIGVEMEAYGVFVAASESSQPRPTVFIMKAVVDRADVKKSDRYQKYGAYTSARFMHEFACEYLTT